MGKWENPWENRKTMGKSMGKTMGMGESSRNGVWMGQCLGFFLRPNGGVLEIKTQIRSIDLDDLG